MMSAGGQLEQPSEVNNSTRTGLGSLFEGELLDGELFAGVPFAVA
jgi:hypothetical protein